MDRFTALLQSYGGPAPPTPRSRHSFMGEDEDKLSQIKQFSQPHAAMSALRSAEVSKNQFLCYFYLMMGIGIGREKKGRMDHIVFIACCYVNK